MGGRGWLRLKKNEKENRTRDRCRFVGRSKFESGGDTRKSGTSGDVAVAFWWMVLKQVLERCCEPKNTVQEKMDWVSVL